MVDMQNTDNRLSAIGKKIADCLDARTGDRVSIGADRLCALECSGDSPMLLWTVYAASSRSNYIQVRRKPNQPISAMDSYIICRNFFCSFS